MVLRLPLSGSTLPQLEGSRNDPNGSSEAITLSHPSTQYLRQTDPAECKRDRGAAAVTAAPVAEGRKGGGAGGSIHPPLESVLSLPPKIVHGLAAGETSNG